MVHKRSVEATFIFKKCIDKLVKGTSVVKRPFELVEVGNKSIARVASYINHLKLVTFVVGVANKSLVLLLYLVLLFHNLGRHHVKREMSFHQPLSVFWHLV
jgi:hypothetical protein